MSALIGRPKPTTSTPAEAISTPIPEQKVDPVESVKASVRSLLGKSNRGVDRLRQVAIENKQLRIQFSINDNLTSRFVKRGAQLDIESILKVVDGSGVDFTQVRIEGTFPLVDRFGNSEETIVVKAVYKKTTIDKINWRNFDSNNVYAIADTATIHPTFRLD